MKSQKLDSFIYEFYEKRFVEISDKDVHMIITKNTIDNSEIGYRIVSKKLYDSAERLVFNVVSDFIYDLDNVVKDYDYGNIRLTRTKDYDFSLIFINIKEKVTINTLWDIGIIMQYFLSSFNNYQVYDNLFRNTLTFEVT